MAQALPDIGEPYISQVGLLGLLLLAGGAKVCENQHSWMWFERKINSVVGFEGEFARLIFITSRYR